MRKKIIFIICMILILCIGSVVNATTLKDISGTKYEDAVNNLITVGLVNGYKDNTYKPENIVTRAEMAKLMVIALGQESNVSNAAKTKSKFKDMASNHWALGYINLASDLGIIKGYPDGTFGGNNTVSYAEATTMMVRALDYEEVVKKSTEAWPNNYMTQANKLKIYESVGNVNPQDGAKRGNLSLLLWKMLGTGTCTVTGQNSTSVTYGEGEKMINQKLTKFKYLEDATVVDVDFDDDYEEADVKIKESSTINVTMNALEAAKMYGQKVNVLYNNSTKKIENIEISKNNYTKDGEIEKVTSSKIYIDGGASKGYELPDEDSILLYGIDDLEDAVSAILVFDTDKSTVEYVVAFAPEEVYLALVTETEVTVSKKEGIRILDYKVTTEKAYALADEDDMPDEDDVILYYLNSDNEMIIINKTNVSDSQEITSISSTKMKLSKAGTVTFTEGTYQLIKATSSSLKAMTASAVDSDDDSAGIIEFAGMKYIIIYVNGLDEAEANLVADLKTAKSQLTSYITLAKKVSEKLYTQVTYTTLMKALSAAESVDTTNLSKVQTAYNSLKTAYSGLKTASTTSEKEIVAAKYTLRTLVNGTAVTCVTNKNTYTTASYTTFNTALTSAKTILDKTNATLTEINNSKTNLNNAINALVKNADDAERKTAITALTVAVNSAKAVGVSDEYTVDSYNNFKTFWDVAKAINTTTATTAEIKSATTNLETAIRLLEKNKEQVMNSLNSLLLEADTLIAQSDVYMPTTYATLKIATADATAKRNNQSSTYAVLKEAKENLEDAINNLEKIADVLATAKTNAAKYRIQSVKDALQEPETTAEEKVAKIEAINDAIEIEDNEVKVLTKNLNSTILIATAITEQEWSTLQYAGTYANMQTKLEAAKATLAIANVTSEELRSALTELNATLK